MTLLRVLIPKSPPQVSRIRSVGVTYNFVKRSTIPRGESDINLRANVFGASNETDVLQDNRMEKYQPLGVPFPSSYVVELRCDS